MHAVYIVDYSVNQISENVTFLLCTEEVIEMQKAERL
jgi:hypothetical protein